MSWKVCTCAWRPSALADPLKKLLQSGDSILDDLRAFVELESPSDEKSRTDRFGDFLATFLKERLDASVETIEEPKYGNHVRMRIGPQNGNRPILILGHFDTVWPAGTLARMPFHIDGAAAYGPGILDMKSGLVLGITALVALQESNQLRVPVIFLFTSDEELGSLSSRSLIEAEAAGSRAALVLEPAAAGALKTARKGVGIFRVDVEGLAAHAGSNPELGVSAIDEMARVVLDLHGLTDPTTGTTVNVGVVTGGTRANVTAASATAEVDLRITTIAEAKRLEARILGLKPHNPKAHIVVTGGINRPPMERTAGVASLFEKAKGIARQLGFELGEASVGGASDANFVTPLGIPVVDGLGGVGDGAHATDEHVQVASLPIRAALIAGLIRELQSMDGVETAAHRS
jgi:glutamate carboxypeptidase